MGELMIGNLQLVQEVVQSWNALLEALTFARIGNDLSGLGGGIERVTRNDLPMVKDTLRESLSSGVAAKIGGEA